MDDANDRRFHVAQQGRKFGPLSLAELSSRRLTSDMLVWCEGMPEWVAIGEMPELRRFVHHAAATHISLPPSRSHGSGQPAPMVPELPVGGSVPNVVVPVPPPRAAAPGGSRVKLVGITTIVLGSLGLVVAPIGVVVGMLLIAGSVQRHVPVEITELVDVRGFGILWVMLAGTLFIVSIAMLFAGIGLLRNLRWAAIVAMASSLVCIVAYLISFGLTCWLVLVPLVNTPIRERSPAMLWVVDGGVVVGTVMAIGMGAAVMWHVASLVLLNSDPARRVLR